MNEAEYALRVGARLLGEIKAVLAEVKALRADVEALREAQEKACAALKASE